MTEIPAYDFVPAEVGFATTEFLPAEDGGPVVTYSRVGNRYLRHEFYGSAGHPTRPGAPTEVTYTPAVAVFSEAERESLDAPDVVTREVWLTGAKTKHREDGPAVISYYPGGTIRQETYYRNGLRSNDYGPALIGNLPRRPIVQYYVDGRQITKAEHDAFAEALWSGAPREWALAYLEGGRTR